MKIIVIGAGKVGYSIAKQLSNEDHHVIVIDKKEAAVKKAEENLNVIGMLGSGASLETLHEAGISDTELVIAVTAGDELNIFCCMMAKKLGVPHTIARIRDPEYSKEALLLQEQIGLGRIINPELLAAREISRLIRFSDAVHVDAFSQGKVEMVGFKVYEKDGIAGQKLWQLSSKLPKNILFCAIERDGELIIPRGNDELKVGDVAHIISERKRTSEFFKAIGRKQMKARDVMIAGGGRLAVYIARRLYYGGIRSVIIELDDKKCRELSEKLPFATVIHGDGTDSETMVAENVTSMEYFIAATDRDEENIFAAINAKKNGAKRAIVKINKDNCADLLPNLGIECSVSPKQLAVAYIIRYVRGLVNSEGSEILTLYKIMGDKAEAMELLADEKCKLCGKPLKELKVKRGVLICAVIRGGEVLITTGDSVIEQGDHVIVIAAGHAINGINDCLE